MIIYRQGVLLGDSASAAPTAETGALVNMAQFLSLLQV